MVTNPPEIKNDAMYKLLREGRTKEFNLRRSHGTEFDLKNADFRMVDLRGIDASGVDFSGCYFRQADLRGVDFTEAVLEGASIHGAKISGAYFPRELSAPEIELSMQHGTRMRYAR